MSEPVAWAAFAPDASESRAIFWSRDEAEKVCGRYGYDLFPLYAVRLTDAERDLLEWLAAGVDDKRNTHQTLTPAARATLRGLLERLK